MAILRCGPFFVLVMLFIGFSILAPAFSNRSNLQNVMLQASPVALLALGQLFVVLTRGVDLSVGSNLSLATIVGALVGTHVSGSPVVVIAAMLGVGATVGLVNALIIVRAGINNPFIVTLATLSLIQGVALVVSGRGGESVAGIPTLVQDLAIGRIAGIPTPFVMTLVLCAVAAVFLRCTVWGRWVYAIGGNPGAATRVGIPASAVLTSCYVMAGLTAGVAALLIAGRFASGFPQAGSGLELDAISAVVIGGASFFGGRGGVSAALVGALIVTMVRNGLNVAGVDPNWQLVAIGTILVAALGMDHLRGRVETYARAARAKAAEEGHRHDLAQAQAHASASIPTTEARP